MNDVFGGVRPVVHLPLDDDDRIVDVELAALAERMISYGAAGLVVLGLATEAWALTTDEADRVCRIVVDAAAGRVPVTAGVDGATRVAAERGDRALAAGVDSLMVRPPAGVGPSGLVEHFERLRRWLGCPMLLQDAPQATGVALSAAELAAMGMPVKVEAPNSALKISSLVDAGVEVVAGWGGLHYGENLRRGVIGCMPGCDLGPAFIEIDRLARLGEEDKADDLYRTILPLLSYEAQSLELLIAGAKAALVRARLFSSAATRISGFALDEVQQQTLARLFARLHEDGVPGW